MKKKISLWLLILSTFTLMTGCVEVKDTNHIVINRTKATGEIGQNKPLIKSDDYQQAINYIKEKHYPQAIGILKKMPDYKDSKYLLDQLRYLINGSYISNGIWGVAAITSDGKVQVVYNGEEIDGLTSVKSWTNIKSICARGGDSIEGLTKEGKIITTSTATKEEFLNSGNITVNAMANVIDSVKNWSRIKSFQTFYPQTAVALTDNGSVFAAYPYYEDGTFELKGWNDIVSVADGRSYVIGIRSDGTVICNDYDYSGTIDTSNWKDIVAIAADSSIVGLREDGTVVSTGLNENGEGNVSDWTDIISISTSRYCTLGLKSDGTVVAAGRNTSGQMNVKEWKNVVAIAAGEYFSIGLKTDGTMLIAGDCSSSAAKTPDLTCMKGLYVPHINLND